LRGFKEIKLVGFSIISLRGLVKTAPACGFSCKNDWKNPQNFMNKHNACMIDKWKLHAYNDSNNGNGAIGSMATSAVILFLKS